MLRLLSILTVLAASANAAQPMPPVAAPGESASADTAGSNEASVNKDAATGGEQNSRAAAPLVHADFISALSREIASHFNLDGDLQIELLRQWSTPDRIARDWRVVVSEFPAIASSAMLIRCRLVADGEQLDEKILTLRASLWRDVWVAREPLVNGAIFDTASLETRRVDLFRERDALPAAVGDRSFIFSRAVNAGRVLTWRDIARRPLVRKGDLVEVSAADGMLVITMKGLALQSGAHGEAVTVRNVESRKDFTAFVIDENRVQVRF